LINKHMNWIYLNSFRMRPKHVSLNLDYEIL